VNAWLALLAAPDGDLHALAAEAASPIGWLCAWTSDRRPHPQALRLDPRLLSAEAGPCRVSLLLLPEQGRPLADDPAAVQVRRRVLADGRPAAVSTLTGNATHLAGSVTVARADHPGELLALGDDPFRRLGAPRVLNVGRGLFGPVPPSGGPVTERYSGAPWPYNHWPDFRRSQAHEA